MSADYPRILMYHSISRLEDDPNRLCTSPERFEDQMRYLKRRGLRGVSVRELRRAMNAGATKGLVGLTFDDGCEDFLYNALPVLERFGFSATVFVVVGMLGRQNDWEHHREPKPQLHLLGADGVREVSERGMEVGSHSVSHARLPDLEPGLLEKEVSNSRQILGEVLGQAVEGFCYPYGAVDSRVTEAVRKAHYRYACTIFTRTERNVYDLPRIDVAERDNLLMLATKLSTHSRYFAAKRFYSRYRKIARGFATRSREGTTSLGV